MNIRLTLPEFAHVNQQELDCIFAETGADREMCFSPESETERLLNNPWMHPQLVYSKEFANPYEFISFIIELSGLEDTEVAEEAKDRCSLFDDYSEEYLTQFSKDIRVVMNVSYELYSKTNWHSA